MYDLIRESSSIYIINLEPAVDRYQSALKFFGVNGVEIESQAAINNRVVSTTKSGKYKDRTCRRFLGRSLAPAEIRCFLNHLAALRSFVASSKEYVLILEDDARPITNFHQVVSEFLRKSFIIDVDWDVMSLCAKRHSIYTRIFKLSTDHSVTHAHYFPMHSTGFLWSKQGAINFLSDFNGIYAPYDLQLRHWTGKHNSGLALWPPIVTNSGGISTSYAQGSVRKSKQYRRKLYQPIQLKRLIYDKARAWILRLGFY